ncbi:SCO2522 family protein [Acrocarpospora catenulata]|uniref:SCO2522 family protein n=1 Tax=Acrocarpospora catenulata TaxID=2836182 RepID=UPI001BD9B1BD|nr:SCO2522 family protein [Acrocarpospora catenulata]
MTTFSEVTAERQIKSAPLSHVSVEVGHLYLEDYQLGADRLREQFALVTPWLETVRRDWRARVPGGRARVSTCFLIDDCFGRFSTPAEVVPMIRKAADDNGLTIDYLARESACVSADGVPLAKLVADRLVPDPPPDTRGWRRSTSETGWLANGVRSPMPRSGQAMRGPLRWEPPSQNAKRGHSIFVDVELWKDGPDGRVWSCPFLASVWQLLRLGLLRNEGELPVQPVSAGDAFPADWDELPPVVRLNPAATPFSAYTTMSVLSTRFLQVELAVRTILSQVSVDPEVLGQVQERSADERLRLAEQLVDRVSYVFL